MTLTSNSSTTEPITGNSSAIIIPLSAKAMPTPSATKQSFEAVREYMQRQIAADGKLKGKTGLVGVAISWFMDRREAGGRAIVDEETLAARVAASTDTVKRAVKQLEARKHYRVVRSKKQDGTQATNQYFPILHSDAVTWPGVTCDTRPGGTRATRKADEPGCKLNEAGVQTERSRVAPVHPLPPKEPPIDLLEEEREARHSGSPTPANPKRIIQTEVVAKEGKIGTLTTIAQPSLPSTRNHRGSRLSEDWTPTPDDEAYGRNLLGNGFATTLENFRDYWLSRADAGAVKLNWSRTWKIWCRKDAEWIAQRPTHSGNITVADVQKRICDGKATAADVRLLKDHNKLAYGLLLKGMRSPETNSRIEEFINPRRRPDHDGPTIDAEATEVVPPAELPAPTTEPDAHSEEHREKMRAKLQSLRTELSRRK